MEQRAVGVNLLRSQTATQMRVLAFLTQADEGGSTLLTQLVSHDAVVVLSKPHTVKLELTRPRPFHYAQTLLLSVLGLSVLQLNQNGHEGYLC